LNCNTHFFHFSLFWSLLFHQCITFSIFVQIEQFKLLWNPHLKIYKSSCISKGNQVIFKEIFEGFENRLWAVWLRIFSNPPISRGCNFFAFSLFLLIFSATNVPKGRLHLLFRHHIKWGPTTKMTSKPYLKCSDISLLTLPWIFLRASLVMKSMLRFPSYKRTSHILNIANLVMIVC